MAKKVSSKKRRQQVKRYGIKKGRAADPNLIPVGMNKMGAKDLFKERGQYAQTSYPMQGPKPLDTFDKYNNLYGRVDYDLNPVFLAEDNLLQLPMSGGGETVFALNFVVEAFKDLQAFFQKAYDSGRIAKEDSAFIEPQAGLAWDTKTGVHDSYNTYWENLYSLFVGSYMDSFMNQRIYNFDDFIREYLTFATKLAFQKPITRIAFITSEYINPRASGLVIDLYEGKHDDDYAKYVGFIRDTNFTFYARACERHGFYVDKNAPWRIYANIDNPYMKEKIEKFGVDEQEAFFTTYYLKASNYELDNLKIRFFQLYDLFLKQYPDVTVLSPKNGPEVAASFVPNRKVDGGIKTNIEYVKRQKMTWENLNKKYPDDYWVRLLIYLRAVETKKTFTQREFDKSVRLACEYLNYVGMWKTIEYIDEVYRHTNTELYEHRNSRNYQKSLKKYLTDESSCDILQQNINELKDYRPSFYF